MAQIIRELAASVPAEHLRRRTRRPAALSSGSPVVLAVARQSLHNLMFALCSAAHATFARQADKGVASILFALLNKRLQQKRHASIPRKFVLLKSAYEVFQKDSMTGLFQIPIAG
jgi:hypothetical protein